MWSVRTFFLFSYGLINFPIVSAQKKIGIKIIEAKPALESKMLRRPDDPLIQYTGRIQTKNVSLPRYWNSGVYITAKFKGNTCSFFLNDQLLWGNSHNYIEVIIDKQPPERLQTKWKSNEILIDGLSKGDHTITVCKNTESGIGYLEFAGIKCENLLALPPKIKRRIEYIGNSITCGAGIDVSETPCGKGLWYDEHNAYMSYGPVTSRALNAQWILSSVSGIGIIHSCCKMNVTMPQVFDKINMRDDSLLWNFDSYVPDVATICLGQNDGLVDSLIFCNTYSNFIRDIRAAYSNADIICLSSPIADSSLTVVLKNYLTSIVAGMNKRGDKKVYKYFFSKQYHQGCGGHPDLGEHKLIANELTNYIKHLEKW